VSVDVTFFESVSYLFSQGPVTASESVPLSPSVSFPAPAPVHDVSLPVSLEDTTTPLAVKPVEISDLSTLIDKKFLPLNQYRPTSLQ